MRNSRSRSIRVLSVSLLALAVVSATAQAQEPVEVTSSYAWSHQPEVGERETLADGTVQQIGEAWQFRNLEASDPRLEGTLTLTDTLVTYPGGATVSVGAFRIENDEGAWQQLPTINLEAGEGDLQTTTGVMVGEGEYAGLIAVFDNLSQNQTWTLHGYIIEGGLPADPEPMVTP